MLKDRDFHTVTGVVLPTQKGSHKLLNSNESTKEDSIPGVLDVHNWCLLHSLLTATPVRASNVPSQHRHQIVLTGLSVIFFIECMSSILTRKLCKSKNGACVAILSNAKAGLRPDPVMTILLNVRMWKETYELLLSSGKAPFPASGFQI